MVLIIFKIKINHNKWFFRVKVKIAGNFKFEFFLLLTFWNTIYNLLENYRTFWNLMELSLTFWNIFDLSWTFWNILELSKKF